MIESYINKIKLELQNIRQQVFKIEEAKACLEQKENSIQENITNTSYISKVIYPEFELSRINFINHKYKESIEIEHEITKLNMELQKIQELKLKLKLELRLLEKYKDKQFKANAYRVNAIEQNSIEESYCIIKYSKTLNTYSKLDFS